MPRGGKRPGAGRPKGSKDKLPSKSRMDREQARAYLRERVIADIGPLLDSQLANAKGIKYLMVREKGGKFVRVTEAMAGSLADEAIVEVWEKDPSVQAFSDLMNRTIDKPTETLEAIVSVSGLGERIQAARERVKRG